MTSNKSLNFLEFDEASLVFDLTYNLIDRLTE